MVGTDLIVFFNDLESGFAKATLHVRRVVHLAVAVSDAGEVQRGLLQTERGGFIGLTVPEKLQDIQIRMRFHRHCCPL